VSECPVCARNKAHQRAKWARWKAHGLCPKCGRPSLKYVWCLRCRESNAKAKRRYRAEKRADV
jgi:hypothetical protein